jgi:Bacterial protein of unknown function (Gcw_chp)
MRIATLACSMAVAGLMSSAAMAQDGTVPAPQAPPAPAEASAPKRLTVTTGLDFTSAYFFRGIRQHSGGTIAQPYFDLGVALGRGATLNVGNWDSVHSTAPAGNWYESDYYGAVTFTAGKLKPGVLYTSYTSPADSFATVKELAGVFAIDDSASAFPLSPKAVLAFELSDAQADGGAGKGVYLELGVKPAVKLAPKASLLIPVKAGLSLKDYYEGPLGNNKFGYFDTGLQLSVPAVSGKSGTLEIHGGFDILWLGDNMKLLNSSDGVKPIGLIGFTYTY